MRLASFSIQLSAGKKTIIVNGEDLTALVNRVVVEDEAGAIPQVFLGVHGEGVIEGEGVVTVQREGEVDLRDAISGFLQSLDPGMVEKAALDRLGGFGGDETTGQAFLNALSEIVRGDGT